MILTNVSEDTCSITLDNPGEEALFDFLSPFVEDAG